MRTRLFFVLALALVWCATASAQATQPITVVADYWVKAGKEEDFLWLVNNYGGPVRDKLMAEGVVMAWGVDVPVFRAPGQPTHSIWYDVADWGGVEKVMAGMEAKLKELTDQDKKAADDARRRGQKAPISTAERIEATFDMSKTKDWIFRNLYVKFGSAPPPAGASPVSRIFLVTAKPGKAAEWRAAFDKYFKPTLDAAVDNGTIGAWGLGIEEVRSSGEFTHFVWVGYPNMAAMEKMRNTMVAMGAKRSEGENEHINDVFTATSEAAAARSFLLRPIIFKMGGPPK